MVKIQSFLKFLFPKLCLFCSKIIHEKEGLACSSCVLKLPLIRSPFCKRCGQPLPSSLFQKNIKNPIVCSACRTRKFPFSASRSVMAYDEDTAKLILKLKYGDRGDLAIIFAELSMLYHKDLFEDTDFIIPVPLSLKRLLFRKYNQSALIGKHLSKLTDLPMLTNVLKRKKFRVSQGGLSFEKRFENVKDSFFISKKEKIQDKKILLVDDVIASGATILQCVKTIKKAGAKEVRILSIARTI
ncbi:MAG: ComF family protein [Alphaproteobacteria bacterium]|nr:MAG: hypothetical protein B6I23_00845 [Rickettsiaceae bacterium 4572_127]